MYNPYLVIPFIVWAIAQFLKFSLAALAGRLDYKYLYASGGMPSVHAAVVTSLATTAYLIDGPKSAIFGITAILAGIVMYDSFGVRRSAGEQAVAINLILDSMNQDKLALVHPTQRLREILGHKPVEVVAGAALGLFLGGLFNLDRLQPLFYLVTRPVNKQTTYVIAVVAGVLLVSSVLRRVVAVRKYRHIPIATEATLRMFWSVAILSVITLGLAFLEYEKVSGGTWVLWPTLAVVFFVSLTGYFVVHYRTLVPAAVRAYAEKEDKKKWLEGPNKKRRAKVERSRKRK